MSRLGDILISQKTLVSCSLAGVITKSLDIHKNVMLIKDSSY
jgi:hypothetical protein